MQKLVLTLTSIDLLIFTNLIYIRSFSFFTYRRCSPLSQKGEFHKKILQYIMEGKDGFNYNPHNANKGSKKSQRRWHATHAGKGQKISIIVTSLEDNQKTKKSKKQKNQIKMPSGVKEQNFADEVTLEKLVEENEGENWEEYFKDLKNKW